MHRSGGVSTSDLSSVYNHRYAQLDQCSTSPADPPPTQRPFRLPTSNPPPHSLVTCAGVAAKVGRTYLHHVSTRDNRERPSKRSKQKQNTPVRIIDLHVLAQQLLLPGLVGQVPPDKVAVLLGLEERDQVDAAPHLLAGEFAFTRSWRRRQQL